MIINDKYKVMWSEFTDSFARPVLYTRETIFGISFWWRRGLFKIYGELQYCDLVHKMSEEELKSWFMSAIAEYESEVARKQTKSKSIASEHKL